MPHKWLRPVRAFRPVAIFYVNLSLLVSLVILAIYLGIYVRNHSLVLETVREQAASYFDLIVRARRWNAGYKGVYVEKKPGVETNPFLLQVGVVPDVAAADGRTFTMRNPALMTREISLTLGDRNGVRFHITSLKLLNPGNAPDDFERGALLAFEGGKKEVWALGHLGGEPVFRYMAPLYVEKACLTCHGSMGYKPGDVRGGISVSIPYGPVRERLRQSKVTIVWLSVFTVGLVLAATYLMLGQLVQRLDEAQQRLREISITDELTGLRNRRHILERLTEEFERSRRLLKPMAVVLLDLDHFKEVNDTHGHPVGDLVLRTAADRLTVALRGYDVAGRYGGEEFLVVLPETDLGGALALAERIRETLASAPVSHGATKIGVTASIGCAALSPSDEEADSLVRRADAALYRAKRDGRNRVEG